MAFIRPLGFILLIILVAFLVQHGHFDFNFLKTAGLNLEQKVEDKVSQVAENLPPPLRHLANNASAPKEGTISTTGIIAATNVERQSNGNLPALKENSKLDAAALAKVKDMFANQYFEHTSPRGLGPADLAKSAGYSYILIGENLALGNFANNQELLTAWMNSPGHRANILNNRYSEMGAAAEIGLYEGHRVWIAVQEFGLPLSSCPAPDPALEAEIEKMKDELDKEASAIDQKKKELDNTRPKYGDAYNEKAKEYNQMVSDYNALLKKLKAKIEIYNKEVREFNDCVEG